MTYLQEKYFAMNTFYRYVLKTTNRSSSGSSKEFLARCPFDAKPKLSKIITKQRLHQRFYHNAAAPQKYLLDELREAVGRGEMIHDVAQERAAKRLTSLQKALGGYSNDPIIVQVEAYDEIERAKATKLADNNVEEEGTDSAGTEKNHGRKFEERERIMVPRGLFLHGSVGTGKTHLMNLFYKSSSVASDRKKRVHFHSFMQDVHRRIHELKQNDLAVHGRNFSVDVSLESNPIHRVAMQLASEVSLLCFDEFQVTDVADALILSQLFQELFRRGTVVVATSNRHPSTLYEGGLNRSYFLPFINLLCKHCIIHDMKAQTDYRIVTTVGSDSLFYSSKNESDIKNYRSLLEKIKTLSSYTEQNVQLSAAFKRIVIVPEVYGGNNDSFRIAHFHFDDLCNKELGSSDYRAIAKYFGALIIDRIPILTLKEHDQARRFITLVDELYEAKCVLACSSVASDHDSLFVGRESNNMSQENPSNVEEIEIAADEAFGVDVAQSNGVSVGGLASVQELSFAFKRAASRLKEMTSRYWWERRQQEMGSYFG